MATSLVKNSSGMNPAKVIGIQFSILSADEIRKTSVAHITSKDTYVNNKPVIGGLFDPRMGVIEPGLICPTDGYDYIQTPGYFGHIELARPVFFIQYFNQVIKILRCVCFKCSKILINKEEHQHALELKPKERWDYVFSRASRVHRCGDENPEGCGCRQPDKIAKEGIATIMASWASLETEEGGAATAAAIASSGVGLEKDGEGSGVGAGAGATASTDEDGLLTMKITPEIALRILRRISDDDITFLGFSPVWSRPDSMICQVLPVPPPAVRPSVKHDAQQRSEDDITHIIVNILKANTTLRDKILQNADEKVIEDWTSVLQYFVATMVNNSIPGAAPVTQRSGRAFKSISERLNGKGGRVRGNLMGKRVDFSARSVITPDANLSIRELGVPLKIAMNMTFPVKVNTRTRSFLLKLVQNGPDVFPGAKVLERATGESISLKYVDRMTLRLNDGDIVHRHLMDGDAVLFNRQPTLHRMSMMCHIVRVMREGNTFRMNVGDTKPYNADFDGDEMNMHAPQDDESSAELRYLAAVPYQIISPAHSTPIIGIFQDSLLGSYRFTRPVIDFDTRKAMNLMMNYPRLDMKLFADPERRVSNFELLTQILPPLSVVQKNGLFDGESEDARRSNNVMEIIAGKMLRGHLEKGMLGGGKGLIHRIFNDYGHRAASDFIDSLQDIITEYMKSSSFSVGVSDLVADRKTKEEIVKAITDKKQRVYDILDQVRIGAFENNSGKSNAEMMETKINSLLDKARDDAGKLGRKSLSQENRFVVMVNSGSKGGTTNIAQMISCLGQQNVDGRRIPYGFEHRTLPHYAKFDDSPEARGFVESSFIRGLNPQELFFHAMGGRVGLIDTAVKTSQTGYIQRRLIKGMEDLKVEYDMTVRDAMRRVVQFSYGDDGVDTTKIESIGLPLIKMTIEQIYAHFHMPEDDATGAVFSTSYTTEALSRVKAQRDDLMRKTKQYIEDMITARDTIVANVLEGRDETSVRVPINFQRLIFNIKNQVGITASSMVDISPMDAFTMIEQTFAELEMMRSQPPSELLRAAYFFYLSPKELLMTNRFNRAALVMLLAAIVVAYKKAIVAPGEMVGMIAAQSIGEPTTQMTLNTFHLAGVASKSNVTRGVPRIEELLSLSENPKNPSITVFMKPEMENDKQKTQQMLHVLEHTKLRDVVKSVSICFDPDDLETLIDEDRPLMAQYREFEMMMRECAGMGEETAEDFVRSKWIVRFVMDKEQMLERNITMDDIHFAIKNGYKDYTECVFSDYNADKLVFRLRLMDVLSNKKKGLAVSKQAPLDQSDEIYMIQNIQENLLDGIILKGVRGIRGVVMRKQKGMLARKNGAYVESESWVLDTIGTNLLDILGMPGLDNTRTYSNDIIETFAVLGIEATRQMIYNEIAEVMEHGGAFIDYHHLGLLCDRMCMTRRLVSIFRHGINNDDIGPIAKASFEETPEMFLRAARHAELDPMRGVSANVMCGQRGNFGTSSFGLVLDVEAMSRFGNKKLDEDVDIEKMFVFESADDPCSSERIQNTVGADLIRAEDMGDDDDEYDPGF